MAWKSILWCNHYSSKWRKYSIWRRIDCYTIWSNTKESAESTEIVENTEETEAIEESLVETQSINGEESDAINETNSTIYEVNDDDLVQLDDGTWVSREEYGPGFVYIETEAAAEETTASESEEQPIENPVPETMPEETEVNIIIMETQSAIGPGMNID